MKNVNFVRVAYVYEQDYNSPPLCRSFRRGSVCFETTNGITGVLLTGLDTGWIGQSKPPGVFRKSGTNLIIGVAHRTVSFSVDDSEVSPLSPFDWNRRSYKLTETRKCIRASFFLLQESHSFNYCFNIEGIVRALLLLCNHIVRKSSLRRTFRHAL